VRWVRSLKWVPKKVERGKRREGLNSLKEKSLCGKREVFPLSTEAPKVRRKKKGEIRGGNQRGKKRGRRGPGGGILKKKKPQKEKRADISDRRNEEKRLNGSREVKGTSTSWKRKAGIRRGVLKEKRDLKKGNRS